MALSEQIPFHDESHEMWLKGLKIIFSIWTLIWDYIAKIDSLTQVTDISSSQMKVKETEKRTFRNTWFKNPSDAYVIEAAARV